MILKLEILLLQLFAWFNQLPVLASIPVLLIGFLFFIKQFIRRKETIFPGLIAGVLFVSALGHILFSEDVINFCYDKIYELQTIGNLNSFPYVGFLVDPFLNMLVAPLEVRRLHQELIFIIFFIYLLQVLFISLKEYKRTGNIFGDMSISSAMNQDTSRPERSEFNELGSGDLANNDDLEPWLKPTGNDGDTALMVTDLRGADGIAVKTGKLYWPSGERNRHILTVAKTGSGKTSKLILPILYNDCLCKIRSTIVVDAKPEMWSKLANLTREHNPDKKIILFNPLDKIRTLSWNILSKIEDDTDCKLIANTVIMATDNPQAKSDNPFFRNNALAILNAIMVGLLHDPEEQLTMPRIHQLVQSGMKPLCNWLEKHPNAFRTSRSFVELARSGSQNADTIMSELSMRISAWDLTAIRATTAVDELNIADLIREPCLFIVEFRESEIEMLRPLANVIVIELLRFLTKSAEKYPGNTLPRPVGLVIDEFASALGRLPDIHVKLNTLRSRNVSIVAAIQSIAQVKANYGDDADSVLAGFSTKIFMPTLDVQDSEWASKETGQMTIRFSTSSSGSNKKIVEWFASKNISSQEQVQQRAVLTPDEIGRPSDNRATFFLPNTPPFQGFLVPFFKNSTMLARINSSENEPEYKLREKQIEYSELVPSADSVETSSPSSSSRPGGLPLGITDTKGWSDEKILTKLKENKTKLDWDKTTGSARKWWDAFEEENKTRMALVLRLADELKIRGATITEFFLAYVYSNTDNIQANLHYLDYTRLKKQEEKKKRKEKKETVKKEPIKKETVKKEPVKNEDNKTEVLNKKEPINKKNIIPETKNQDKKPLEKKDDSKKKN